jgi:hypothetical protein
MAGKVETDIKGQFIRVIADDDPLKISQRTGVSFQLIQALNPNVDLEGFKVYISTAERTESTAGKIETDGRGRFTRVIGDDNPWKIGQRTGVRYQALQALNPDVDFAHLVEGLKVYISAGEVETDSKGNFVRLTSDDDPWKISQRTGVSYQVVLGLNPNVEVRQLEQGFKVYISAAKRAESPIEWAPPYVGNMVAFDPRY